MSTVENGPIAEQQGTTAEAESELREKNQITVPKPVVEALGAHSGDRFVWIVEDGERGIVRLHRIQNSYAGNLTGVYGRPGEVHEYLTAEREAWGE